MKNINRRKALKRAALIMGGTISAPVLAAVLKGCTASPGLTWKPTLFSEDQARIVTQLADIIVPATDTPGASELGVPKFIEEMINMVYTDKKEDFIKDIERFDEQCIEFKGQKFLDLDKKDQMDFVSEINSNLPRDMKGAKEPTFFYRIKELTITGYFTTELAMKQILQYIQIPIRYDGCIPLKEAGLGKTWAV